MEQLILTGNLSSSDIPSRITEPFSTTPEDIAEISNRLQNGGKLTLENAVLEFGEISPFSDSRLFLGVKQLKLKNSKIITNGNFLEIFCDKISMDSDSKIISFKHANKRAINEIEGDYGGDTHIYLTNKIDSKLTIHINGQDGGNGLKGGTGSTGSQGARGRSARNGDFGSCRRGPGGGHAGGQGGTGSNGTNAGDGGNGGVVDFIDENDDAVLAFDFCQYEWSILDIYQDIDVVDKLIDKSTKQYGDITVSDNKIPQETKELIQEVFNKAFEKDVYS